MRSIVYYGAPPVARWRVHEALAAVSDPARDPDRRAWHLAQATSGPDEEVVGELERSAGRARGRGGWASSAAFLERSAELTQDGARRARWLVAAAEARLVAGESSAARALLNRAAPDLPDPVVSARARRLEGDILFAAGESAAATSVLLVSPAQGFPQTRRHQPGAAPPRVQRAGRRRRPAAAISRRHCHPGEGLAASCPEAGCCLGGNSRHRPFGTKGLNHLDLVRYRAIAGGYTWPARALDVVVIARDYGATAAIAFAAARRPGGLRVRKGSSLPGRSWKDADNGQDQGHPHGGRG